LTLAALEPQYDRDCAIVREAPVTSVDDRRRGVLAAIERAVSGEASVDAPERAVAALYEGFPRFSWVGIYRVEGEELVLGPSLGRELSEPARIPLGVDARGIAAQSGRTLVVDDATEGGYSAESFAWARSMIMVPIAVQGAVRAEIVVASEETAAFSGADRDFLERVSRVLSSGGFA
jgi:GAF domain-containing protein